jgi:hypothetical protein
MEGMEKEVKGRWLVNHSCPLPRGFAEVLILEGLKVLYFDTLLQVLILNDLRIAPELCISGSCGSFRLSTRFRATKSFQMGIAAERWRLPVMRDCS